MKGTIFGLPSGTAVKVIMILFSIAIMFVFLGVFFPSAFKFAGNMFHSAAEGILGRLGWG